MRTRRTEKVLAAYARQGESMPEARWVVNGLCTHRAWVSVLVVPAAQADEKTLENRSGI